MSDIKDLKQLLTLLSPVLDPEEYVFASFTGKKYGDFSNYNPICCIMEDEGMTLVIQRSQADAAELKYPCVFQRITLSVHSSLEAVGLTQKISSTLAENGISANFVAGYYHDHIFVPTERAEDALALILKLTLN